MLKPNGILINYTPDWETQYLNFYDDITHIKPFSKITLENCYKMYGFETCNVEKFYQLPLGLRTLLHSLKKNSWFEICSIKDFV